MYRSARYIASLSLCISSCDRPTVTDSDPTDSGSDDSGVDTSGWVDDGGPTIYEIQQGVYALDSIINLEGVLVSSPFSGYGFFATEPQGGEQAGIWIYTGDVDESELSGPSGLAAKIQQGDRIAISGIVTEYYSDEKTDSLTELMLQSVEDLEVLGQGNLPAAEILSTSQLSDPATAELWEGCLVAVEDVTVSNDYLGPGEWMVDDSVVVDDMFMEGSPIIGEVFDLVAGPLYYSYGNYMIEPRDSSDLVWTCPADACVDDLAVGDIVITELMDDPASALDDEAEWFEIYNASNQSINLKGLVVGHDGDETTTLRTGTVIGIDGYAVFGVGSMESWAYTDFEPDGWYSYGAVGLSNEGDTLHLYNTSGILDSSATYGADSTDEGTAWQLDSSVLDSSGNNDASSWCAATSGIGSSGDLGSPREPNDSCN